MKTINLLSREQFKNLDIVEKAEYINTLSLEYADREFVRVEYLNGIPFLHDLDDEDGQYIYDVDDYADMLNTEATDLQGKMFK